MKNKGILILSSILVLLSAYSYFGEYKGKEKEKINQEQNALILKGVSQDQINFIEINNLTQKLKLNRTTEGWILSEPIKDSADNSEMDSWLKQMTDEKSLSIAVEGSDIQWAYFGFDKPTKSVSIKTNSGQQFVIEVSEKKNFEGNNFIRYPGENRVLVAGSSWGNYAGKSAFELRNKRLFRHQISNISKIEITTKKSQIEIENKDARWQSAKYLSWSLDQNAVRELITKMAEVKASEFLAESSTVNQLESAKKKLNLVESNLMVKIKLIDNTEWSAKFYQAKDQVKDKSIYIEVANLSWLVKSNNEIFDRLNSVNLSELRDYKLPFATFDKQKAEKFSYETTLKKVSLMKKKELWSMEAADPMSEVQQEKVSQLLEVIKNLTAKQYVSTSEIKKDLTKQRLIVKDATDQNYFELQFSESETKKVNNEEKTIRYAKTNFYSEPFILDESEFEKLSLNELIKTKANSEGKALPVDVKKVENK